MTSADRDIAIIGMACIYAGAPDLATYWQNIVNKVDSVSEPPEDWGYPEVFDPDSGRNDRVYTRRGGYLGDLATYHPVEFGTIPRSVEGGEPDHFLAMRVAKEALDDAGNPEERIDRERVEVIVGKGTYANRGLAVVLQHGLITDQTLKILKTLHPEYSDDDLEEIRRELKKSLPPFTSDTLAAIVPNILCNRIANRLDFMGPSYVVDAACASSMIALQQGVQDLISDRCDMVVMGGVHASAAPPVLMTFCQIEALSRTGQIKPFDKDADGTLLGEGVGMMVLKRRADAERDNDRIYALIKGIGTSSDGKALGLLAPRVEGQVLAMKRAWKMSGIDPRSTGLIEAHGTGTTVGDVVEMQSMSEIFGDRSGLPTIAVGTVKSMISHTIPAAGTAGLIKTALAIHHRVLPPTLHCKEVNPAFEIEKTPFYINTETRPWIHGKKGPRRAGVNAFGFGGVNGHAILEEYTGETGK